ncbi:hypothetical protein QBC43DRAFT_313415 [Cladorrhinum sp. PSN259]|nr:hypothetical protein QBC43DRAFT_313415 [Cladorrhinum sp. PSN259]
MSPPSYSAQLYPGRGLGYFALGTSLHDVLTRIKSEPTKFPRIELKFASKQPFKNETNVELPGNGIRFRFDGPEQRLRLIEILDFTKNHVYIKQGNDKERDLVRPESADEVTGPTFKHIYQRFLGPTYAGEYIQNSKVYILSYPGVAFTFPMMDTDYSPTKDIISLIPATAVASSMAIFSGESWAKSCKTLWTEVLPSIRTHPPLAKTKDASADEVSLVKIHGGGKVQLFRKWTKNHFWIFLGETTPQQLIHELGPPDAIYYKNDQRMGIHRNRTDSNNLNGPQGSDIRQDDLTDTDLSSHPASDDSSREEAIEDSEYATEERFFNYFHQGFDILIATRTETSEPPPSQTGDQAVPGPPFRCGSADRLVATKIILHGNVPGSYPFNRYRRCRWEIAYLPPSDDGSSMATSETAFPEIQDQLREEWKSVYASESDAQQKQRGMALNRGWGDSPGSSIEMLGGWEDSTTRGGNPQHLGKKKYDGSEDSTTNLYGFPGIVFEVLKNGFVSAVTVY